MATVVRADVENGKDLRIGGRLMIDERGLGGGLGARSFSSEAQTVLTADCFAALEDKSSRLAAYEFGEVFIEYIAPPVPLLPVTPHPPCEGALPIATLRLAAPGTGAWADR